VTPPLEQHGIADQLEPRGELEIGLSKHLPEFVRSDISGILDFPGVQVEINVCLDEKDIVN
jgi:hypothetical protein